MTNHQQHRTMLEERRQQRTNRRRLIEILGLMVILVTAYALMVPAISITQDAATQESGFYQAEQVEVENITTESESLEGEFAAVDVRENGESQDAGDRGGAEATDPVGQDEELAKTGEETLADDTATSENSAAEDAATEDAATEDAAAKEPEANVQDEKPAQDFHEELKDERGNVTMTVSVKAPKGAFAAGTTMRISEIDADEIKAEVEAAVQKTSGVNTAVKQMTAVNIIFLDADGNEVEPAKQVEVKITSDKVREIEDPVLVHVVDKDKPAQASKLDDAEVVKKVEVVNEDDADKTVGAEDTLKFKTKEFSPYVIVETETIEANVLASDGNTYNITVTYGPDAGIPAGAELDVREIVQETEATDGTTEYEEYVAKIQETLGWEGAPEYARFFDISIMAGGAKVQPVEGSFVNVEIRLNDIESVERPTVVHFTDDDEATGEIVDSARENSNTVSFMTDGFSAYAIVDGPGAIPLGWQKATSLDGLTSSEGFYIGHTNGFYFMNVTDGNSTRMGIKKTKPAQSYPKTDAPTNQRPAKYYFEKAGEGKYYAYCYANDGTTKQYVYNGGNNSLAFADADHPKTAFTVNVDSEGKFTFNNGSWFWNMQGGDNGTRFCSYNDADDKNNKLYLWYYEDVLDDPYDLDGRTYGLMNWNGGAAGKALMAAPTGEGNLEAKAVTTMTKEHDGDDHLFVPNDSEISMWTFHWDNRDNYRISVDAGGSKKYLNIGSDGKLSLVSNEYDASLVQVVPGTGIHSNEISLKSGNKTLTYSGSIDEGFNTSGTTGSEWLYLTQESELSSDYIRAYSAKKVSVSDQSLTSGSKIIIYTRFWNEKDKKYDFYAIDKDGKLVRCYDNGDSIEWVRGLLNDLLWQFTEYTDDKDNPTGYYEFYNEYSEKYIAPQVAGDQVLSDDPIGVNLPGRRSGKYYTPILAWDIPNYNYAGLTIEGTNVEEGDSIVTCLRPDAMDFYFATMEDLVIDDAIHTVDTIDNTQYGIKMKMINIGTRADMSNVLGDDTGGVTTKLVQGMLSTQLGEDGYPTTVHEKSTQKDQSLGNLYVGAREVNKLFIESTFRASGYYEFDSSQNFAHLQDNNEFLVYKELGSYDSGGNKPTLKHGQFLPFNNIQPGLFASVNKENLYSATAQILPDGDPRKHEQLYLVQNVDCYFAVELEASFVQTPNGLDAWDHDIIYEFTGDDDFWLYVDGELVIDLGGIHSAVPGSVNFRTGEVNVNGTHTTLYDLFYKNYLNRYDEELERTHTTEEAQAYVDEIFTRNGEGNYVFKDNTKHTMRIFYMERGAGASNLHMRFNLASIKPGTVLLSKELAGVESAESVHAEFLYQVFYEDENGDEQPLKNSPNAEAENFVVYKDTVNPVTFKPSVTVGGVKYDNVFILKPGEVAEVSFPDSGEDFGVEKNPPKYRIVECGVNTGVYKSVSVAELKSENNPNGLISGTQVYSNEYTYANKREDFGIPTASTEDRPTASYVNEVEPDALRTLTITKKVYDETGLNEVDESKVDATFRFRLYLATELDGALQESPAAYQSYHVKDPSGYYCSWSESQWRETGKGFVLSEYTDFTAIPDSKKDSYTFPTSEYGAIDEIPAFYTVEVRDVLAGTQYRVEERPWNVPDGYSYMKYENYEYDGTAGVTEEIRQDPDGGPVNGVEGTVVARANPQSKEPHVDVCNIKGWGLRINKTWTDADFMTNRDAAYFAVFTDDGGGNLTLVPDTVRQMAYGSKDSQTLYWYFETLPVEGKGLADYVIREVTLGNPTVNEDGVVTNYGTITIIDEGEEVTLSGTQKGETDPADFTYTVSYTMGTISSDNNVRIDTATNTRPGIVLKKQDWSGNPLAGATFELKDNKESIGTFTSSEDDGLIAVAFLGEGKDYTLTETNAPQRYLGLQGAMTINLSSANGVTVSGVDSAFYDLKQGGGTTPTLTIKDRPYTFKAVKIDGDTEAPLVGVKFALHRQVTVDGVIAIDPNPMPGYEELTTGEDGRIPLIDETLPAGTYELREKNSLPAYSTLASHIRFTVSPTGLITLGSPCPDDVTLTPNPLSGSSESGSNAGDDISYEWGEDDTIAYVMTIPNWQEETVSFFKVDIASPTAPLAGATFDLYEYDTTTNTRVEPALYTGLTSGDDGLLALGVGANKQTAFKLRVGTYHLIETDAPDGYNLRSDPVVVTVHHSSETASNPVTYDDGTTISQGGRGISEKNGIYKLTVTNTSGYELPSTGGSGTLPFTIVGGLLVALAAVILLRRRVA